MYEHDYHSFLRLELEDSNVLGLDFEALESDYNTLSNLDEIQSEFSNVGACEIKFYDRYGTISPSSEQMEKDYFDCK